jgi:hypothetical protein
MTDDGEFDMSFRATARCCVPFAGGRTEDAINAGAASLLGR